MTDVTDGLQIKLECGSSIHWPHKQGLKLHTNVLVFWDFTKNKAKEVIKAGSIDKLETGEPSPEKEEEYAPNLEDLGPAYDAEKEETCIIVI